MYVDTLTNVLHYRKCHSFGNELCASCERYGKQKLTIFHTTEIYQILEIYRNMINYFNKYFRNFLEIYLILIMK